MILCDAKTTERGMGNAHEKVWHKLSLSQLDSAGGETIRYNGVRALSGKNVIP